MEKLNYSYTQNRELSWLRFNERVLLEAEDEKVPLFEKFRFIWIFSSNLDEFCMIRIGSLTDLSLLKNSKIDNKTGQSPREQLDAIFDALPPLYKKRDNLYLNLVKELKKYDINQLSCSSLNKKQIDVVQKYFTNDILPILSSQIVDTHHPFPFLLNQELHIILELKVDSKKVIGIIPVPKSLPNILEISSEQDISYVFITDIIETHLDKIFTEYKILSKAIIRVTRNADLSADDEIADNEEDYREHMKKILKKRNRLQSVRLESNVQLNDFLIKYLCKNLIIKPEQCFISKTPLNMKYINELEKLIDPKILKKITYFKYIPKELKFNSSIIDYIKHNDLILNFPYQSMNPFINLIDEAAANPDV